MCWGASHQVIEAADNLPLLEVGLAVQCGRFDVAQAVWVTGAQQQHVGRKDLIAPQPDKVSHVHLFPVYLHVPPLCSATTAGPQTCAAIVFNA